MLSPFIIPFLLLGIDSVSIELNNLLNAIVLICFISILCLSIMHLATSDIPETIDPALLELNPKPELIYREKQPEKDKPRSDIVWTRIHGAGNVYIYDQDNPDGVILISLLAKPNTNIEARTVNGIQYVGLLVSFDRRVALPSDQIKRSYNAGFLSNNTINITSRREPLEFYERSVILKCLN